MFLHYAVTATETIMNPTLTDLRICVGVNVFVFLFGYVCICVCKCVYVGEFVSVCV